MHTLCMHCIPCSLVSMTQTLQKKIIVNWMERNRCEKTVDGENQIMKRKKSRRKKENAFEMNKAHWKWEQNEMQHIGHSVIYSLHILKWTQPNYRYDNAKNVARIEQREQNRPLEIVLHLIHILEYINSHSKSIACKRWQENAIKAYLLYFIRIRCHFMYFWFNCF